MSLREEQFGKFYMGNREGAHADLLLPENQILRAAQKQRESKEMEEAKALYLEVQTAKQKELESKLETLELMPMYNKVIILPYPENPYRKLVQGSIIVEFTGEFNNPDTGEKDKQETFVGCAQVKEIGPDVKYVKVGDDVFYDNRTCYPVPFMSLGYRLTTEPQLLCVLNEGLKTRFKME
jgi:hypothetical protein